VPKERIAVVDAGLGNLRSVVRGLERAVAAARVEAEVLLVDDPLGVRSAARVVVPGQGAFGEAAAGLRHDAPLGAAVLESIRAGKPYLGICLGHQVLFEWSEESPAHPGLGLFPGVVRRLPDGATEDSGDGARRLKIPHIGWAEVSRASGAAAHPVLDGELPPWFYFVHSYHAVPEEPSLVARVAPFGSCPITAAVARDNVLGVQFHPEKSQASGLALLARFVAWRA
jgi:glutamine amidotransferase